MSISIVNGNKTFLYLSDTTLPVTPANGTVLYSDSGILKYLNSSGTPVSAGGVSYIEILGQNELFIGTGTGNLAAGASQNLGIGLGNTLSSLTTGDANIGIGMHCAELLGDGSANIAIGDHALAASVANNYNIAIGFFAGSNLNDVSDIVSSSNTILGSSAASTLVTGDSNVILGYSSGQSSNNYRRCLAIGTSTTLGSASDNCFVIGNNASLTNPSISNSGALGANASVTISNAINIGESCNVGINKPSPDSTLSIANVAAVCSFGLEQTIIPPATPSNGISMYWDGTNLSFKDDGGVVHVITTVP